jgi:hypothetical protein
MTPQAPLPFVRARLCAMMFLEIFIWGAWFPLIFGYLPSLGFSSAEQGWITSAFAMASLTAMFFSTQFADRHFAAQRFCAFSHLVGGLAILGLYWVHDFWPFFGLMLLHSLFYVPTISITNGIAFAALKDPQREFGRVRLWGTIGWIAASWPFVFVLSDWAQVPALGQSGFVEWLGSALGTSKTGVALQDATRFTFVAAGGASLLLAALCLALPHTPPRRASEGAEAFAWLESLRFLRKPFIAVLFVVTFLRRRRAPVLLHLDRPLPGERAGRHPGNWVMPVMSIGQIAEVGTMAVLGYVLKSLGWRKTMTWGVLGHAVRFALFAAAPTPTLVVVINLLHGVCYAFFFATVYIFVDDFFPKDARSSAQGLFNLLILGLGPFAANFAWTELGRGADARRCRRLPHALPGALAVAFASALLLFVFFRPPEKSAEPVSAPTPSQAGPGA